LRRRVDKNNPFLRPPFFLTGGKVKERIGENNGNFQGPSKWEVENEKIGLFSPIECVDMGVSFRTK
jgi:hypothetical protein